MSVRQKLLEQEERTMECDACGSLCRPFLFQCEFKHNECCRGRYRFWGVREFAFLTLTALLSSRTNIYHLSQRASVRTEKPGIGCHRSCTGHHAQHTTRAPEKKKARGVIDTHTRNEHGEHSSSSGHGTEPDRPQKRTDPTRREEKGMQGRTMIKTKRRAGNDGEDHTERQTQI